MILDHLILKINTRETNQMKYIYRPFMLIMLGALLSTVTALAQVNTQSQSLNPDEITDEDLQMVVNISDSATGIQEEANAKMKEVIENEGMPFERFQEIVMSQQNPQLAGQLQLTDAEQLILEKIQPDLLIINQEAQQQYKDAITNEGLTLEKFQQIAMAIQTHPEVAQRFDEIRNGTGS